jgi:hypothetical protein
MAELPQSWDLHTRLNGEKCEVWGKSDIGEDYKVRTCDGAGLTENDVAEIAAADRETTTAKEFVDNLSAWGRHNQAMREAQFMDELTEAAGPVVHAGLEKAGATVGYSRTYANNFDKWLHSLGE